MKLVQIADGETEGAYDQIVGVPEGMDFKEAVAIVDAVIAGVKESKPYEYQWSDMESELLARGFVIPEVRMAHENW